MPTVIISVDISLTNKTIIENILFGNTWKKRICDDVLLHYFHRVLLFINYNILLFVKMIKTLYVMILDLGISTIIL